MSKKSDAFLSSETANEIPALFFFATFGRRLRQLNLGLWKHSLESWANVDGMTPERTLFRKAKLVVNFTSMMIPRCVHCLEVT